MEWNQYLWQAHKTNTSSLTFTAPTLHCSGHLANLPQSLCQTVSPHKPLPEWICDLTDTGEWLRTGSRMSTLATGPTETLYRSGKSVEWKIKRRSIQVSQEPLLLVKGLIRHGHSAKYSWH